MTLEEIIKTEKQILEDGNTIENNIIQGCDITVIGHFGNLVSLNVWADNCCLLSNYNNTNNLGWIIKALVELYGLTDEDGYVMSKFKNIPCRIIVEGKNGGLGGKVIGFGHFMKDKFVYKNDLVKITE